MPQVFAPFSAWLANIFAWARAGWKNLRDAWLAQPPEPDLFLQRIRMFERNLGVFVRGALVLLLAHSLFVARAFDSDVVPRHDAASLLRHFFFVYALASLASAFFLRGMNELSPRFIERIVYVMALLDAAILGLLTYLTDGFDSLVFWLFLASIIRNAAIIPHGDLQVAINILVTAAFIAGGILEERLDRDEFESASSIGLGPRPSKAQRIAARALSSRPRTPSPSPSPSQAQPSPTNPPAPLPDTPPLTNQVELPASLPSESFPLQAESRILRILLLLLMTGCCLGIQKLVDQQRLAEIEASEFALKQQQLEAAGRLAAEIAHQLKNPLAIINNAAWSLQHAASSPSPASPYPPQELAIIREEVARCDQILTELMGYAQLAEGKIERLNVPDELNAAIDSVLPKGSRFRIDLTKDFGMAIPALAMQRSHFREIFVNLLTNARDALAAQGQISLTVRAVEGPAVQVSIQDSGPGISPEVQTRIFEPYFTTKKKGTGLGLAIVKHNAEFYGGSVQVHSTPGQGTTFVVTLPVRTLMRLSS